MTSLRFVERRDDAAGWSHLVVIGGSSYAIMEFQRAEWCGWKHVRTTVKSNAEDWPSMTAEEIEAWMRREWSKIATDFTSPDVHAVAKKFAPSVTP